MQWTRTAGWRKWTGDSRTGSMRGRESDFPSFGSKQRVRLPLKQRRSSFIPLKIAALVRSATVGQGILPLPPYETYSNGRVSTETTAGTMFREAGNKAVVGVEMLGRVALCDNLDFAVALCCTRPPRNQGCHKAIGSIMSVDLRTTELASNPLT